MSWNYSELLGAIPSPCSIGGICVETHWEIIQKCRKNHGENKEKQEKGTNGLGNLKCTKMDTRLLL